MPNIARRRFLLSSRILGLMRCARSLLVLTQLLQFDCGHVNNLSWLHLLIPITVWRGVRTVFGRSICSACFTTISASLLLLGLEISTIWRRYLKLAEIHPTIFVNVSLSIKCNLTAVGILKSLKCALRQICTTHLKGLLRFATSGSFRNVSALKETLLLLTLVLSPLSSILPLKEITLRLCLWDCTSGLHSVRGDSNCASKKLRVSS